MTVLQNIVWVACFAMAGTGAEQTDSLRTLLSDADASSLAVVYVRQPADLCSPLEGIVRLTEAPESVGEAIQATAKLFDGPFALVVTGSPLRPDLLAVTITAKVSADPDTFYKIADRELVAALNRTEGLPGAGSIGFERSGTSAVLRWPGAIPVHLHFAMRDGYVRVSTDRTQVDSWEPPAGSRTEETTSAFIDSTDFKRLVPAGARTPDLLAYVNCRTLMPLAQMALRDTPEVDAILGLDQLEGVGLAATWSETRTAAELTMCLAGEPRGLLTLLKASSRPVEIGKVFPADTVFMAGGKLASGAELAERVNGVLDLLDPEIVQEYEQERTDFVRDFGFDIHTDLLGNFVDEWAFAIRSDGGGLPEFMLAVRLGDPGLFEGHVRALAAAFDLQFDTSTYRQATVFAPSSARVRLAYSVVDDYLIVGRDADGVARMIDASTDHQGLDSSSVYREATKRFSSDSAGFAHLDLSRLMRLALEHDDIEPDPSMGIDEAMIEGLRRLASQDAALDFALQSATGRVSLSMDLSGGNEVRKLAGEAAWTSIGASLGRAREMSKRAVSMANLQGIVRASLLYAKNHQDQWPGSLAELVRYGSISLETLGNVYDGTSPRTIADADRESYYLYRGNPDGKLGATDVVAGEREIRRGEGANFAFADGHARYVQEPEASRLLAVLRANAR
ncbi:MAG: hypothetical protein GY842_26565 [bacterium]|nr:hypothetical protein [bacterium]